MSNEQLAVERPSELVLYHIKYMSTLAQTIGVVTAICSPVLFVLIIAILKLNGLILICGLPILAVAIYYFFKNFLTQRMTVSFADGGLHVKYTSKPFFDKEYDRVIFSKDILSYETTDFKYQGLTLHLVDGTRLGATKAEHELENDFVKVKELILAMITVGNASGSARMVERTDNQFEGKRGAKLAIVFIVLICLTLIGILFFPDRHKPKDVVFGLGYVAVMLSYVIYIYSQQKKKRE
jgi:hypothetical protein